MVRYFCHCPFIFLPTNGSDERCCVRFYKVWQLSRCHYWGRFSGNSAQAEFIHPWISLVLDSSFRIYYAITSPLLQRRQFIIAGRQLLRAAASGVSSASTFFYSLFRCSMADDQWQNLSPTRAAAVGGKQLAITFENDATCTGRNFMQRGLHKPCCLRLPSPLTLSIITFIFKLTTTAIALL